MSKVYEYKKVVIVGVSASGKSTFARRLAEKTKLPLMHMDAIMWQPDWKYVGDSETEKSIHEISKGGKWIIEGYINKAARYALFEEADKILYLDYSRWLCAWRYIKRCWHYRKNARPELSGSPDTFSFAFLKLVWTKGEAVTLEQLLAEHNWGEKLIRLKSPKESLEYLYGI